MDREQELRILQLQMNLCVHLMEKVARLTGKPLTIKGKWVGFNWISEPDSDVEKQPEPASRPSVLTRLRRWCDGRTTQG